MPANEILAIAKSAGANVSTQAEYAALVELINNGMSSGVVDSKVFNKILRQATLAAAVLGQFTANNQAADVLDDGDVAGFVAKFLAALNGAPGVTPAQFDNSTKKATTEFVQRALGNMSGYRLIGASETLPISDAGKFLKVGTNGVALTLPATAGLLPGATYNLVIGDNTGITINTTGGIGLRVGNALQTLPLALPAVTDLKITWRGDIWEAHSGSGTLKFEPQFAASMAANGYQKLPSGLIVQWGQTGFVSSSTGTTSVGFPILFPNAVRSVLLTPQATAAVMATCEAAAVGNFNYSVFGTAGRVAGYNSFFLAIGH